jgi:hypothetical protein
MVQSQEALMRQLRGVDHASDQGVRLQAIYVVEWAEQQIRSVCPLTVALIDRRSLLSEQIAAFLKSENRSPQLHDFRQDFLAWVADRHDQKLAALATWERNVDSPLSEAQLEIDQNALRSALDEIGIRLSPP